MWHSSPSGVEKLSGVFMRFLSPSPQRRLAALLLTLLLTCPLQAGDPWEKPSDQWTLDDALKILNNSPWVRRVAVTWVSRTASPLEPSKATRTAWYLVRWNSAWPVATAFARLRQLGGAASADYQSPPSRLPDNLYAVTVRIQERRAGYPILFHRLEPRKLLRGASLRTIHSTVQAVEAELSGPGVEAAVHFYFPRAIEGRPLLNGDEKTVEFIFNRDGLRLRTKFKLPPGSIE